MRRLKGEFLNSYLKEIQATYNPNYLYLTKDGNSFIQCVFHAKNKIWMSNYGLFATQKMNIMPIITKIQVSVLKAKWQDKLPNELWNVISHFLYAQSDHQISSSEVSSLSEDISTINS